MKELEKKQGRLRQVLRDVYRQRETSDAPDLDGQWETSLMRRVRMLELPESGQSPFLSFTECVWRLTPVSVVLIVVLTVCMTQFGVISEYEIATRFMNDPLGFSLTQVFGI
jgi:hypothetical protein